MSSKNAAIRYDLHDAAGMRVTCVGGESVEAVPLYMVIVAEAQQRDLLGTPSHIVTYSHGAFRHLESLCARETYEWALRALSKADAAARYSALDEIDT